MITDMKQNIFRKCGLVMGAALLTISSTLLTACHDGDWDAPASYADAQASYGNKELKETNVITIEQLKTTYASVISDGTQQQVTKDTQIKGVVIGNDAGGNIYKSVYLQDATGVIQLCINRSNTSVYLPVGQTVLVELNGLYVGSYGKQPQIGGGSYVSGNYVNLSRMEQAVWMQHFKLVGKTDGTLETVTPIEVKAVATGSSVRIIRLDDGTALNIEKDCGRLVTLRDIELGEADGTSTYATATATTNRSFKDINSGALALRTSNYADFALAVMPTGKLDITGILGRYNNGWQLLLRTEADEAESKGEVSVPEGLKSEPAGDGTATNPYNVAAVTAYTMGLGADVQSGEVYATGIVTEVSDIDITGTYGNATYLIADDSAGETGTFQIYRGYGLNGEKFNAAGATIIKKGDVVVIKGKVVNYKGNTPQFAQGSTIVSIN